MATKKEWKDYLKINRLYVKQLAEWIRETFPKGGAVSTMDEGDGDDDEDGPGSNPPQPPPPPPPFP